MPKKLEGARIAFLDFSIQKAKMHLGVQVLIDDPEKLKGVRERLVYIFNGLVEQALSFKLITKCSELIFWTFLLRRSVTIFYMHAFDQNDIFENTRFDVYVSYV